MFAIRAENIVSTFAPILLKECWRSGPIYPNLERRAALFCFDVEYSSSQLDESHEPVRERRSFVWVLVTQDHKVFYQITDTPRLESLSNFKFTSGHDSCWRTDGLQFLTTYHFQECNFVDPDLAPVDVNYYAGLCIFSEPGVVTVELERDRNYDGFRDEWTVTNLQRLDGSYFVPRKDVSKDAS